MKPQELREAVRRFSTEREWAERGYALREPPAERFQDFVPKSDPPA